MMTVCVREFLAVLATGLLAGLVNGVWCWRLSRRLHCMERWTNKAAIPEPVFDPQTTNQALPRFIGSPFPSRRGPG
jgi:hypothetical protein